jgi:twitching motility protein PilT
MTLQAILCQALLPHASGVGRVLASELLIVTPAIRNLVREQKIEQIYLAIQTGGRFGMQTMNQCLYDLWLKHQITTEMALENAADLEDLRRLLQKGGGGA